MKTKTPKQKPAPSTEDIPPAVNAGSAAIDKILSQPIQYKTEDGRLPVDAIEVLVQVRTAFGGQADTELLESIRLHGVQSHLWVRPRAGAGNSGPTHVLIAGERRLRAAKAAGLLDVPVKIYYVDEKAAKELQIIENLQRENVSEVDEGRAYKDLLQNHGYNIDKLCATVSKSKSYIYGRIKLAELPKLALEAKAAGKLSASVCLRVARIPDARQQLACTQSLLKMAGYGEGVTDRSAASLIEREYMRQLKGASFDLRDAGLVPVKLDGHIRVLGGSCTDCPHRSGNQPDLFDKSRADVCTNPACFTLKKEAQWKRIKDMARSEGLRLIPREEAQGIFSPYGGEDALAHNSRFVKPSDKVPEDPQKRTYGQLIKKARGVLGDNSKLPGLALTLVPHPSTGNIHRLFLRADAKDALIAAGFKFYQQATQARRNDNAEQLIAQRNVALDHIRYSHLAGALVDHIASRSQAACLLPAASSIICSSIHRPCANNDKAIVQALNRIMPCDPDFDEGFQSHALCAWLERQPSHIAAAFTLEVAIRAIDADLEPLAKVYGFDLEKEAAIWRGKIELARKSGKPVDYPVGRTVLKAAQEASSMDRIGDGKPVKSFIWRGLQWTCVWPPENSALMEFATVWEMVPAAAYDGTGNPENYEGKIVCKGGIEYRLRGPAISLIPQSGECRKCGVTEVEGWKEKHSWADPAHTQCSLCFPATSSLDAHKEPAKPKSTLSTPSTKHAKLSPEARTRIAAAMRARWTAARKEARSK